MINIPLTITFLGTGTSSGVPMIGCSCAVCTSDDQRDNRLRSSILVQSPTTTLVVDTTPDFRYQMLRIHNKKLDAVVFTHAHKDHIAGLDDIRAYNYFQQKPMEIYANTSTVEALQREFYYAFADKQYPGVPQLNMHVMDETAFAVGDICIEPVVVWHLKMKVFGFKFGNFCYITDANKIDEAQKDKIRGCDHLVLNALRKEQHISHFTLQEAVQLAEELQIPNVYFTHISHQLGRHAIINQELPSHMQLAYDGLTVQAQV